MSIKKGHPYLDQFEKEIPCPECEKPLRYDAGYGLWVCKDCDKEEIDKLYEEGKAKRAAIYNARKNYIVFEEPSTGSPGEIFKLLIKTQAPGILNLEKGKRITWKSTNHPSLYSEEVRKALDPDNEVSPEKDLIEALDKYRSVLPPGWIINVTQCCNDGAEFEIMPQ